MWKGKATDDHDRVHPSHPVGRQKWSLGLKVLVVGEVMMMQ